MQCSTRSTFSRDRRKVRRLAKLTWFPSAARSPWLWPVFALAAVAAVGQWAGVTIAEAVAVGFGAIGIGIAIGLAIAGKMEDRREPSGDRRQPSDARTSGTRTDSRLPPVDRDPKEHGSRSGRTVDLRGACLVNAMLVRADLRQADLRGATLTGADLTGANLTGAQLGPLDESSSSDGTALSSGPRHLGHNNVPVALGPDR